MILRNQQRDHGRIKSLQQPKISLFSNNNLRKYSVNKEYFKIPNEQNCYWAGFIAADGCVEDKNRLSIGLKKDDINHLEEFSKAIEYTNNVKLYNDVATVTINCKEICEDLRINFNIVPRKSKILIPPNIIDEDLVACFIKGVIDGDGSIDKNKLVIYGTKDFISVC